MALDLSSLKKSQPEANPLILLYGVAGVGKDTLAAEFPNAVRIKTADENVPKGVEIPEIEVSTYAQLDDTFAALATQEHGFDTLIISSLDGIEQVIWANTCAQNNWANIEQVDYGKGYVAADADWAQFLSDLRLLRKRRNMTIVIVGHTEIGKFDDPASAAYSRYLPNLHKRARDLVIDAADITAFVNYRVSITKEKGDFGKEKTTAGGAGQRIIYLEERPGFIAKNRYGMPPEVAFKKGDGWKALVKAGLPAPAAREAAAEAA